MVQPVSAGAASGRVERPEVSMALKRSLMPRESAFNGAITSGPTGVAGGAGGGIVGEGLHPAFTRRRVRVMGNRHNNQSPPENQPDLDWCQKQGATPSLTFVCHTGRSKPTQN